MVVFSGLLMPLGLMIFSGHLMPLGLDGIFWEPDASWT